MRTQRRSWMTTVLAFAAIALAGSNPSSPDPEQALLGRTKAVVEPHEISSSRTPISGSEALLGMIARTGVGASAESGEVVSADYALFGR